MRLPQCFQALLLAAVVLLFVACNSNDSTTTIQTDSASTSPPATPSSSAAAVANTPEKLLVIRHKIANYAKWKAAYDAHDSARMAAGVHSYVIGRGMQDSNTLLVSLKVDDSAKAIGFVKDPGLKAAMQKGGVLGTPVISLASMTFVDTSDLRSKLRSSVSFTVKDWDAWYKDFEEGAQERKDNGLVVRAYGHNASDNHKVRVVTALVDSAKAMAYFKSDLLKQRMKASGVTDQPERFLYSIVQRY